MYVMHVTSVQGVSTTHISMSLSDVDDLARSQLVASWRTTDAVDLASDDPYALVDFLDQTIAVLVKGLSSLQTDH